MKYKLLILFLVSCFGFIFALFPSPVNAWILDEDDLPSFYTNENFVMVKYNTSGTYQYCEVSTSTAIFKYMDDKFSFPASNCVNGQFCTSSGCESYIGEMRVNPWNTEEYKFSDNVFSNVDMYYVDPVFSTIFLNPQFTDIATSFTTNSLIMVANYSSGSTTPCPYDNTIFDNDPLCVEPVDPCYYNPTILEDDPLCVLPTMEGFKYIPLNYRRYLAYRYYKSPRYIEQQTSGWIQTKGIQNIENNTILYNAFHVRPDDFFTTNSNIGYTYVNQITPSQVNGYTYVYFQSRIFPMYFTPTNKWALKIDDWSNSVNNLIDNRFIFESGLLQTSTLFDNSKTLSEQIRTSVPIIYSGEDIDLQGAFGINLLKNGDLLLGANYNVDDDEFINIPLDDTYFIEYKAQNNDILKLISDKPCYINTTEDNTIYPFNCNSNYNLYLNIDGNEVDITTGIHYPPSLYAPDSPLDYCNMIIDSNYYLKDHEGVFLCKPITTYDRVIIPFEENLFDPNALDSLNLGIFDPIKPVFVKIIEFFNSVWARFWSAVNSALALFVPDMDLLKYTFDDFRNFTDNKLPFKEFGDFLTAILSDQGSYAFPKVTGSLMGVQVTFIDFELITQYDSTLKLIVKVVTYGFLLVAITNTASIVITDRSILNMRENIDDQYTANREARTSKRT